jgi:hypothetical protein
MLNKLRLERKSRNPQTFGMINTSSMLMINYYKPCETGGQNAGLNQYYNKNPRNIPDLKRKMRVDKTCEK